mgnify:CR=1 FL=1
MSANSFISNFNFLFNFYICHNFITSFKSISYLYRKENTLELVKFLIAKYKVPATNVVRHYDAPIKNCPSAFSKNDWTRWKEFSRKLEEYIPLQFHQL